MVHPPSFNLKYPLLPPLPPLEVIGTNLIIVEAWRSPLKLVGMRHFVQNSGWVGWASMFVPFLKLVNSFLGRLGTLSNKSTKLTSNPIHHVAASGWALCNNHCGGVVWSAWKTCHSGMPPAIAGGAWAIPATTMVGNMVGKSACGSG